MQAASAIAAIALKTGLLVAVVGVVSVVIAKQSAACRHLLWTSALALCLLMPLAALYMPPLAVIAIPWHAVGQLPDVLAQAAQSGFRAHGLLDTVPTILVIWSIGAFGLLIREVLANVRLIHWARGTKPLESSRWAATLERVSDELSFTRRVRVLESAHVTSPCTWGFLRPVLLLPAAGTDWPESQRRHALLHELAHIRRCDDLGTRLSRLACAIHWYNPLVWFAAAQARKLQEQACDDAVLRGGGTPSDYAQFLLSIARTVDSAPGDFRIATGMTRHSDLYGRVVAILEPHKARMQPSVFASLVALLPMFCLMLVLAATTTVTAQDVEAAAGSAATEAEPVTRAIEAQASQSEQKARAAEAARRAEAAIVAVPAVKPLPPKPPVVPPVPPAPTVPPSLPPVEPVPPPVPPG